MTITKGLFTSNTDLWETPQGFFDKLNQEFRFETDVCATPENAKCPNYFTAETDGLSQEWQGVCWMNPPYGREIGKWIQKAYESSLKGATVVCLLPARTDTKWWHNYCMKGEIRLIKGRIKFEGKTTEKYLDFEDLSENGQPKEKERLVVSKNPAPFPSAVVIFGSHRVNEVYSIGR